MLYNSYGRNLRMFVIISGLYYKLVTIVNDDSRVVYKLEASLTDDTRVVIYNCHMLIVLATGVFVAVRHFHPSLLFVGKAWSLSWNGASFGNIRLD